MISSLVGAVIMSAATVAMLIAIKITGESLDNVGKNPITEKEIQILPISYRNDDDIKILNEDIKMLDFNN